MQNRFGLITGIAVVGLLISLPGMPTQAGQQQLSAITNPENTLLGIQLLKSNYRDVLRKYGQPSEIQAGGPFLPTPPAGMKQNTTGGFGGPGMPGMGGGMPGSGGGMGMPGGKGMGGPAMPGSGGGMGMPGGGGGGGKKVPSKNGFPGKNNGGGGGGMGGPSGYPGGPGSGGRPGFGPGGQGMGNPGKGGEDEGEGGGGSLGSGQQSENQPMYETTFWYHRPLTGEHFAFVFNRKGEVIQVGEYGSHPLTKINGKTRQGVDLGSSEGTVINKYGFSLDGAHDGDNVIMRYGGTAKIAFQMVNRKVLGITIGVGASPRRGGAIVMEGPGEDNGQ